VRYYHKCTYLFLSTHYSCKIPTKLQFSQEHTKKYSNIKCHENPFSGNHAEGQNRQT